MNYYIESDKSQSKGEDLPNSLWWYWIFPCRSSMHVAVKNCHLCIWLFENIFQTVYIRRYLRNVWNVFTRKFKYYYCYYFFHLSTTFPMLNIPCLQLRESLPHWLIRHLPTITVPKCNRPSKSQVPSRLPTVFCVEKRGGQNLWSIWIKVITYGLPFEHK